MNNKTEDNFAQVTEWLASYKKTDNEKQKKQLQNLIVVATMPLVKKIACSLARRSTDPIDDLIQVGSLGLIKAIEFYNPDISTKFKTYASYLITGEIRHYLRDKASMIKAPREIQELAFRINNYIKQLVEESGDEPTTEEVAKAMDVSVQKVNIAIEVDRRKNTILQCACAKDRGKIVEKESSIVCGTARNAFRSGRLCGRCRSDGRERAAGKSGGSTGRICRRWCVDDPCVFVRNGSGKRLRSSDHGSRRNA